MGRRGFMKTIALAAVTVVVIGFVLYAALQPAIGWPAETRRVVHPGGFSIVRPDGWEEHFAFGGSGRRQAGDALSFLPVKVVGAPGYFVVTRVAADVTEKSLHDRGYTATRFLGRSAYEKNTATDLTREHLRSVIFERDGVWYDISIRRPIVEALDSGVWQAYAESFRVEPVAVDRGLLAPPAAPATLPAVVPPATTASP